MRQKLPCNCPWGGFWDPTKVGERSEVIDQKLFTPRPDHTQKQHEELRSDSGGDWNTNGCGGRWLREAAGSPRGARSFPEHCIRTDGQTVKAVSDPCRSGTRMTAGPPPPGPLPPVLCEPLLSPGSPPSCTCLFLLSGNKLPRTHCNTAPPWPGWRLFLNTASSSPSRPASPRVQAMSRESCGQSPEAWMRVQFSHSQAGEGPWEHGDHTFMLQGL